jgi:putative membrane protein
VAVLAAGAAAALATVWMPPLARLFLVRARGRGEAMQVAHTMFLESGLSRTRRRHAALLLVSLFEREAVVLADPGVRETLGQAALEQVVAAVTARLARGALKDGLLDGLGQLEDALAGRGFRPQPGEGDDVSNAVIEREGP